MLDFLVVRFWNGMGWKRQQRFYQSPNGDIMITMTFWYNAKVRRGWLIDGRFPLINEERKLLDAGFQLKPLKCKTGKSQS